MVLLPHILLLVEPLLHTLLQEVLPLLLVGLLQHILPLEVGLSFHDSILLVVALRDVLLVVALRGVLLVGLNFHGVNPLVATPHGVLPVVVDLSANFHDILLVVALGASFHDMTLPVVARSDALLDDVLQEEAGRMVHWGRHIDVANSLVY